MLTYMLILHTVNFDVAPVITGAIEPVKFQKCIFLSSQFSNEFRYLISVTYLTKWYQNSWWFGPVNLSSLLIPYTAFFPFAIWPQIDRMKLLIWQVHQKHWHPVYLWPFFEKMLINLDQLPKKIINYIIFITTCLNRYLQWSKLKTVL